MKNRRNDLPERTFGYAVQIDRLCQELDQKPGASRTLSGQLLRSGTSIGANVQEGLGAQSEADSATSSVNFNVKQWLALAKEEV